VLVATPGRLIDLVEQRILDLRQVEILVLDEADQMLDLGFIHDLKRIVKMIPAKRQSLFFSATMPKTIRDLADRFLTDPAQVVGGAGRDDGRAGRPICHLRASRPRSRRCSP
jgi:ATP-dependent RNA helicase RhlE